MKKLRIMHGMSEIAGQNSYSVRGLKEIGEKAESVIYNVHPFSYSYDKCLFIDKTKKIRYPFYIIKLFVFFIKALYKYDCFHFHYGHSILNGVELPLYKIFKKKVFFEFHGSDLRDMNAFSKINGLQIDNSINFPKIKRKNNRICKYSDGIILHDDELLDYLPPMNKPIYIIPLRIDFSKFEICLPKTNKDILKIVHAPSKRDIKGTKYVLDAFLELKNKYNNIELILVEGKSQSEAINIYKEADIIIDQLFVGTYGVFAIEAMALGKPVITYISDEMKEKLPKELPIISANINTLKEKIEYLIYDENARIKIGSCGRKYVEQYHNYRKVARVLKNIYYDNSVPLHGRDAFNEVKNQM